MRTPAILLILPLLAAVAGCKPETAQTPPRPIRSIVAIPKPIEDDRQAVGEVRRATRAISASVSAAR